jgi:hypothetical protein
MEVEVDASGSSRGLFVLSYTKLKELRKIRKIATFGGIIFVIATNVGIIMLIYKKD